MKIIRISASNLPLFDSNCELDFIAKQRVSSDGIDKLSCLSSNTTRKFYSNNVLSFIGINASGKTTILKLITFVCKMLNNESINNISYNDILDGLNEEKEAIFDTYFYENDNIHLLHTVIIKKSDKFIIKDEYLKSKNLAKIKRKADIFSFDDQEILLMRNNDEAFLLNDVSIMIAFNKKTNSTINVVDMLQYTNINQLNITEDCPPELIAFFDPSIEYLNIKKNNKDNVICLKFKDKEEIIINHFQELNRYLSSGTIKGINIFLKAIQTFSSGGYLIIDELENHFNHEIVSTLIRFFLDKKVNSTGAVMIFSTHYAELLDEFERNDCIYIVRNRNGITANNLSSILKRNDIKKSEAYESGFLEGTVPMYDAYINLKKSIIISKKESSI